MTVALLLRAASGVALVQFVAHTLMFVRARPRNGAEEEAVVAAMRSRRFRIGGAMRSYWDMYFGYGLQAAAFCLLEAALFWMLSGIAPSATGPIRPIVGLFCLVNVGHLLLVWRFFFITPMIPDALIAAILASAWLTS